MSVDPDSIPMYDDDLEGRAHRLAHACGWDLTKVLRCYENTVRAGSDTREVQVAVEALDKVLRVVELQNKLGYTPEEPEVVRPHVSLPRHPRRRRREG